MTTNDEELLESRENYENAQSVISVLVKRLGGEVSISKKELVEQKGTIITNYYLNKVGEEVIIKVSQKKRDISDE